MKVCSSCRNEFAGGEIFCPNDGARLTTPSHFDVDTIITGDDPLIGTVLAERYKILRQIGEGGMGLVYEAEHIAIEKRVALKVLRDDFSGRSEVVQRFRQEAKSASRIGNEHIVDISDFGMTPSGANYFVMELLTGEDLAEVLSVEGQLPVQRAADIILQCCKALAAAHAKGIVHRDMKPENIFLTVRNERPDFVKLVDFGIAKMSDIETAGAPGRKLTKTGMIFGTPEYMSPEQAAGKELDHRVDIYALATIMFEMLTGRVPFVGDTFMGILTQHMFEDPPSLFDVNPSIDVPDQLVAFIYKGLAKDPDLRYQSCDEMAAALSEALAGQFRGEPTYTGYGDVHAGRRSKASAIPARAISPSSASGEIPLPRPISKIGIAVLGVAILLAASLGAGGVYYLGTRRDDPMTAGPLTDGAAGAGPALVIADPPTPLAVDAGEPALPPPAAVDAGSVPAPPAAVTVTVNTSPADARIYVVGRGEVCPTTPCSFQTPPGESITVRATRGRSHAETSLLPRESTTIQLAMQRVGGGGATSRRGGNPAGGGQPLGGGGGGGSGDLKIPEIFRRN